MPFTINRENFLVNKGDTASITVKIHRGAVDGDRIEFICDSLFEKKVLDEFDDIIDEDGNVIASHIQIDFSENDFGEIGNHEYELILYGYNGLVSTILPTNPQTKRFIRVQ